ncbi:myosin phosphatase Rho-interacting protein isoform X2 [Chanos chanos]|uniref:Myosin phosphatase Rho-interacting protein isoform X2 n=1 Tax=Chanos chanos TaxID=29144 RepID=A0A6J2UT03_CHACN|nr:centrosome-associated protein CEP250-like isoform X2 [Chanos chanos]
MSAKDNPCRKFQANIFNKSKCQNCFKPRESHLLNDEDCSQAKPIYGGWLLLAPEGTNFDNPLHRSRKWQRRFFVLYEHGLLRYALDEMPTTLAQGTINMNVCVDVVDGEAVTGQKNALCISTPDREHYIRSESKDVISGWQEALIVYPRTNKQNQKKKRKVEPHTAQVPDLLAPSVSLGNMNGLSEPGPAKVAVTSSTGSIPCLPSSIAQAERVPPTRASLWQEDRGHRTPLPTSHSTSCLSQHTQSEDSGSLTSGGRKVRVESGYFSLEKNKPKQQLQEPQQQQPLSLPTSSSSSSSSSCPSHPRYTSSDSDLLSSPSYPSFNTQTLSDTHACPDTQTNTAYRAHTLCSPLTSSQSSLESEPSLEGWGTVSHAGGAQGRGGRGYVELADVPRARRLSHREAFRSERKHQELRARTRSPGREEIARLFGEERRRSQVIERFESLDTSATEHMDTEPSSAPPTASSTNQRQGRAERRQPAQKQELSLDAGLERKVTDAFSFRRAKSLDRRATESSMTISPSLLSQPDLLNFKKGWMTKLYEDAVWKKHWFVLTDQSLKYYRDSVAEEAADMDGEIDLSSCYDVTEFPVQRNYGFQIHSKGGAITLSAMTSGIRRSWMQAIMKNARPAVAPDVTRTLPEDRTGARAGLEPEPSQTSSRSSGSSDVISHEEPLPEQRKSRVRDRRREGRSKTFDWTESQPEQEKRRHERGSRERAGTLDIILTSTSFSSPSSSSSATSSPGSTISSPQTSSSVSIAHATDRKSAQPKEEAEQEHVRRHRFRQTTPPPNTPAVSTATRNEPKVPREEVQGQMEVDQPDGVQRGVVSAPDIQVEIEQRWHQVETTPLREEKQVPITVSSASLQSDLTGSSSLPPQELAAVLDKELGQTQKELARLQEQNSLLQEQLQDARGREQSAREGYVLQTTTPGKPSSGLPSSSSSASSSSTHQTQWQRLSRLNQDLKSELASQQRKHDLASQQVHSLRRSYSEAQDIICRHEAEIEALQVKLNAAMAEIVESEQAVARMRSELKMEQSRCIEREEEWNRSEATLRAQLRDSEDRLRDVEASLLEKNQALRQLERQQALHRDQQRETQRLQERLTEVTGRLIAMEEAQALREQRELKEKRSLVDKYERERQALTRRLAESEESRREVEDQLQETRQQMEALLRGGGPLGTEVREEVQRLQEELSAQSDVADTLRENVRRLEEERDRLTCRCQELLNQITEADREVGKLQARLRKEETEYYSLESSYERVSEEFAKISRVLLEKEEEVQQTKETYERLVQQKEQDLKEALIKIGALGSSLEETELLLQEKEELLSQMGQGHTEESEPRKAEQDLQAKLVVAEDRIAELEEHLNALRLGYADLRMEQSRSQDDVLDGAQGKGTENKEPFCPTSGVTLARRSSETEGTLAKRQRIRFSSIQCQKYIHSEGAERMQVDRASLDATENISQDLTQDSSQDLTQDLSIVSDSSFQDYSDPEKFMCIIHTLESKLLAAEEKLRDATQKTLDQQHQLELREQSGDRVQEGLPGGQDRPDGILPSDPDKSHQNREYEEALVLVERCREKVREVMRGWGDDGRAESHVQALAEIEKDLFSVTVRMRQVSRIWNSQESPEVKGAEAQSEEDTVKLFARRLELEALVLEKMALSLQNLNSDFMRILSEIHQDAENMKRSHQCLAVAYTDIMTRKLALDSTFCSEVEELKSQNTGLSDVLSVGDSVLGQNLIRSSCMKAELVYTLQNLRCIYQDKFEVFQKELTEVGESLQQKNAALKEASVKTSDLCESQRGSQGVSSELGVGDEGSLADVSPPELAPYLEQIEMEEAQDLAEEIISRHLARDTLSCDVESGRSFEDGRERLVAELKKQAAVLHDLSREIKSTCEEGSRSAHARLVEIIRARIGHRFPDDGSSLCVHEVLIQAQVAYMACRIRVDHQRELTLCQQTSRDMAALVEEHAQNVATIHQHYQSSLEEERLCFNQMITSLQGENQTLREEASIRLEELQVQRQRLAQLEEAFYKEIQELRKKHSEELGRMEQEHISSELALMERIEISQKRLEVCLQDTETTEALHKEQVCKLEEEFCEKIQQLETVHEEQILRLHEQYKRTIQSLEERRRCEEDKSVEESHASFSEETSIPAEDLCRMEEGEGPVQDVDPMSLLRGRILELESQMSTMRDELENKPPEGDVASLREKYQRDLDSLKATCERGFAAMEETHQKVVEDLQRQHQREISKLLQERDRLLEEETAATIAAIEAMKNAHREELEKTQRAQLSGVSADIDELRTQYEEELQSIRRELEVLSEQYSQKCLENAHLAQALEAERQALCQCQRENQELHAHNQELNNRLTVEISRMRSCFRETATSPLTQGKDLYELEVLLRVKESEIQYLKQEIHSLKDELQSALRDKKYATDKYKDMYTELSLVKAKADCDISKLREKLLAANEALGERGAEEGAVTAGYDIMKSKSNPDFLKKGRSRPMRGVRSKSLKEGLTVQERMKIFEAKDSRKI